ncbi:hypothetical protein Aduo_002604 [Ancylostoma duodenale]
MGSIKTAINLDGNKKMPVWEQCGGEGEGRLKLSIKRHSTPTAMNRSQPRKQMADEQRGSHGPAGLVAKAGKQIGHATLGKVHVSAGIRCSHDLFYQQR